MDIIEFTRLENRYNLDRHPWETTRLKIIRYLLHKNIQGKEQIIDIGSGDAFIAKQIAHSFPNSFVTAVDIHYTDQIIAAIKIPELPNIHFINNIDQINQKKKAEAIILMDVLEHVQHPKNLLKNLCALSVTQKSTFFFITVPAFQFLFTEHDINLGHYRRYNDKALKKLVANSNMKVLYSGYFFNSLLILRLWQKLSSSSLSSRTVYNWKGSRFLTSLLNTFFWMEFKISWYLACIGIKVPGLTCYTICQPYL